MANEHILQAASGAKDVGIALSMKGYEFANFASVADGNYEVTIVDASIVPKKDKPNERNFYVEVQVAGPEDYAGVGPFKTWLTIPVGDSASESFQRQERKLKRFLASVVQALGEEAFAELQASEEDFELTPEFVIGKKAYARLTTGAKGFTELSGFESRETYEENPGPSDAVRIANERFLAQRAEQNGTAGGSATATAQASANAASVLSKLGGKKPAETAAAATPPASTIAATANGAAKPGSKLASMLKKK